MKQKKLEFRTLFISDVHLGSSGCRAKDLHALLKRLKCRKLYLVGDVLDMWRLKQRWYWPKKHNDVVRRVLRMAKKGTKVVYIPGNHDDAARQYAGLHFGGVRLEMEDEHVTADGRRLLITHGDQFDMVVKHWRVLSICGSIAYEWLIRLNRLYNWVRALLGLPYWSLSQYLKLRVKKACTFISTFEQSLLDEARSKGFDGVVCGHIHKAELRPAETEGEASYFNCGDWVESCTLLAERPDGRIELIDGLALLDELREAKQSEAGERPAVPGKAKRRRFRLRDEDEAEAEDEPFSDALEESGAALDEAGAFASSAAADGSPAADAETARPSEAPTPAAGRR